METVVEKVPTWALCYIINGDATGLTEDDIAQIQDFFDSYRKGGMEIQIVSPHEGNEGYFTHVPAFGLPSEVVDCDILYTNIEI